MLRERPKKWQKDKKKKKGGAEFNDYLDVGNKVESNSEVLELFNWVDGDATNEDNKEKVNENRAF